MNDELQGILEDLSITAVALDDREIAKYHFETYIEDEQNE